MDAEAVNDRLAREHSIDDYYRRSPLPIRLIERHRLRIVRELVGRAAGLQLLEIGSGGGHVLRLFPEADITAVDVSGAYLDIARRNLAGYRARFLKGRIQQLHLPKGSFDRIICTEVLEHTEDPEAILSAIAALLRADGIAVITVPNDPLIGRLKAAARRTPIGYLLRDKIDWGGDDYHLHAWHPDAFEALLAKHLRVRTRRHAPHNAFPIRACFGCTQR
jgi:2-polyprenyl-3-methyl-5-hydroxy-6-metoxy-1,4-benzoquinol methylase